MAIVIMLCIFWERPGREKRDVHMLSELGCTIFVPALTADDMEEPSLICERLVFV